MNIDQFNSESYFLSYVDGELSDSDRQEVDAYCRANPDAARELLLLQQTVSVPSATFFEGKSSLYKEEEEKRVIGWYLWRAAAIVVLITGGVFLYRIIHGPDKRGSETQMKASVPETIASVPDTTTSVPETISSVAEKTDTANVRSTATGLSQDTTFKLAQIKPGKIVTSKKVDYLVETGKGKNLQTAGKARKSLQTALQNAEILKKSEHLTAIHTRQDSASDGNEKPEIVHAETGNIAARTRPLEISTMRSSSTISNSAPILAATGIVPGTARVDAGKIVARDRVDSGLSAFNAQAVRTGAVAPNEDDAVSVVKLGYSGRSVRKLFQRITSGKDEDQLSQNSSDKKVNISIFQFALGK